MQHILISIAAILLSTVGPIRAHGGELVTFSNVQHVAHPANDGDSFHVKLDDVVRAIRLYFADTPETSVSALTIRRVREQMRYFGQTSPVHTVSYGHRTAAFTRAVLQQPFYVHTAFASALGSSRDGRIYAFVTTAQGDDLAALLVEQGLARATGVGRTTPAGVPRDEYAARLRDMELVAAMNRVGAWEATVPTYSVTLRAQEREEAHALQVISDALAAQRPRIKLNSASADELIQLKGIGQKRAEAIIRAHPFTSPTDLYNVRALPRQLVNELLPHVEL